MMGHRSHIDNSVELIGNLLFGSSDGPMVLKTVRAAGEPLVHDWSCLKSTVRFLLQFWLVMHHYLLSTASVCVLMLFRWSLYGTEKVKLICF